jgi:hypothetical protein
MHCGHYVMVSRYRLEQKGEGLGTQRMPDQRPFPKPHPLNSMGLLCQAI